MSKGGRDSELLSTTAECFGGFRCQWPALSISEMSAPRLYVTPVQGRNGQWLWWSWAQLTPHSPKNGPPHHYLSNYIPRSRILIQWTVWCGFITPTSKIWEHPPSVYRFHSSGRKGKRERNSKELVKDAGKAARWEDKTVLANMWRKELYFWIGYELAIHFYNEMWVF